jgi:hypothetical protein
MAEESRKGLSAFCHADRDAPRVFAVQRQQRCRTGLEWEVCVQEETRAIRDPLLCPAW